MYTLRTILFWIGFTFSTVIIMTTLSVSFILPFRFRFFISKGWPLLNSWWLKLTCNLSYEIHGLDNIPDEPVIFMSKHQSTWETITYQLFLPPTAWVIKRELLWIPIFGWGVAMLNPIAINRKLSKAALKQIIEQGKKRLNAGINIMIFPEGTRTTAGTKTKYKPGGAILAAKSGRRVVPIAHNAGYFWPMDQFVKHSGTITVVIGKPISTEGKSASEILKETETWIEAEMVKIGGRT
ncbi:MAG: 1-acyl-sn-glycerol-3-phosphate acyltransferase [Gammaproteobacteria bacterium]|nr:1-acyl-sn-glycerol-3-phosphate acyltransferase [Gammaproteobacteria bacterium]